MEELKSMKKALISCVQSQIQGNLKEVDAKELGEAVDMIKDLEEAIYYATITKAMEEKEGHKEVEHHYYTEKIYPNYLMDGREKYYPPYRDMDRGMGRMYFDDTMYYGGGPSSYAMGDGSSSGGSSSGSSGSRGYEEMMLKYPKEMMRDAREGRSGQSRKTYMESKEMHHGKEKQMKELEKYLQELSQDVTEMIQDATPEEKLMLQQKISTLATKIK